MTTNDASIGGVLRRNGAFYADRIALQCEGQTRTHSELIRKAARVGNALLRSGIAAGDRIAVLARNSIEMTETLAACEIFGFIAVPLNHRLAVNELVRIAQDCSPKAFFTDSDFMEATQAMVCCPGVGKLCVVLDGACDEMQTYAEFTSLAEESLSQYRPGGADTAYIIYTSGSTGQPKGVMLSHAGLIEAGRLLASPAGVRPDSVQIVVMPLFHIGATAQRMGYVVQGGKLVLHRRFDAQMIVDDLVAGEITDIHLAPMMLRSVLDVLETTNVDLPVVETVKYASSPIPDETLGRALKAFSSKLLQFYALTEACGIGTVLHKYVHEESARGISPHRLRSAGQPHFGCELEIRGSDGKACEVGEGGEIWIRSPAVMTGYWNKESLTRSTIVDGWLKTGDVGRYDSEKFLFIMDRMKDMIISGGENIYSSEVERALESHPSVLESAVIGIPDERWGEAVHAFVVCRQGSEIPSFNALIDHCKQQIASYKKPKSIQFLVVLPRLQHVQKIDKVSLRKPFWESVKRQVN